MGWGSVQLYLVGNFESHSRSDLLYFYNPVKTEKFVVHGEHTPHAAIIGSAFPS